MRKEAVENLSDEIDDSDDSDDSDGSDISISNIHLQNQVSEVLERDSEYYNSSLEISAESEN